MALAKDQQTPTCSFYGNMLEPGSSVQFPHISSYGFEDYNQKQLDHVDVLDCPNSNQVASHSPPLSSSSSANSANNGSFGVHHHPANYQPHEVEAHSLINFKTSYGSFDGGSSLLNFQQQDDQQYHPLWDNDSCFMKNSVSSNLRVMEDINCLQSASSGYQDPTNDWLFAETSIVDPPQEPTTQQTCFNYKRPRDMEEENMQTLKKQCTTSASKKPAKPKASSIAKDPQSIAAKNRRERISERLKILQDLVPNGTKVDLVTMLEKAIGYVNFLQLQVKVLATDEFWPAAGGKAPDISQVKDAIDAILSSQRSEKPTSSSSK